ncbi:hypothetical protein AOLI_G00049350 [Acnodon oligacanthus]
MFNLHRLRCTIRITLTSSTQAPDPMMDGREESDKASVTLKGVQSPCKCTLTRLIEHCKWKRCGIWSERGRARFHKKGSRCRQEQIKSPSRSRPAAGPAFHHHPVHSSEPKAVQEHSLTFGSPEWCLTTLGVSSTLLQESKAGEVHPHLIMHQRQGGIWPHQI